MGRKEAKKTKKEEKEGEVKVETVGREWQLRPGEIDRAVTCEKRSE